MKKSLTALAVLLNSLCFSQVSSVTDDMSLIPAADKKNSFLYFSFEKSRIFAELIYIKSI